MSIFVDISKMDKDIKVPQFSLKSEIIPNS